MVDITDAASHQTSFAYDDLGRVTAATFPSTLSESYTYGEKRCQVPFSTPERASKQVARTCLYKVRGSSQGTSSGS